MCLVYSYLSFPGNKFSVVLCSMLACVRVGGMKDPTLLKTVMLRQGMYHILLDAGGLKGRRDARTIYLELL